MATKPTTKSNSHNKSISQITVGSLNKILAPSTLKPKTQTKLPGDFLTFFFHRLCRLELTVLAKREGTQTKKNQGRAQSSKKYSYDHKTKQQNPLRQHRHLLGHKRGYDVMVSNFDAESKDPNLIFGGILPQNVLFDDVDYSWQFWLGGKPLKQKKSRTRAVNKKIESWPRNQAAKSTHAT